MSEESAMARSDEPTDDDRPVVPEPGRAPLPDDPEVPEGDALEQAAEVAAAPRAHMRTRGVEVPEADAWEQSIEVPLDDVDDPS
jgi:hypothetical protein